jgi:hypothetical protein
MPNLEVWTLPGVLKGWQIAEWQKGSMAMGWIRTDGAKVKRQEECLSASSDWIRFYPGCGNGLGFFSYITLSIWGYNLPLV